MFDYLKALISADTKERVCAFLAVSAISVITKAAGLPEPNRRD